jgi:hypothetical protein
MPRREKDDLEEMMRMFRADAEWERQRRFGRRALFVIAVAAAIWYGWACQRACIADQDGCAAAMEKYDGYRPVPQLSTGR